MMLKLGESLTDEEVLQIIKEADINGDGRIDFNEFMKTMTDHSTQIIPKKNFF